MEQVKDPPDQAAQGKRRRRLAKVNFPRFEDITPAEARLITRDAPRSGKYAYTHPFSLTGNAAARCLL